MSRYEHLALAGPAEVALAAAAQWLQELESSGPADRHLVALSGGRIARLFFTAIVEQGQQRRDLFARTHFFWADERCVPPHDPESNFGFARQFLLEPLKIPPDQIHSIDGTETPEIAAQQAEMELRRIAPINEEGQPVFDVVFLGMGEDGHIASLFPGEPEAVESDPAVYRSVVAPKPPPRRITLGYRPLAAARQAWVLASGPAKESALRDSLDSPPKTPLGRLLRLRSHTRIYSDIRAEQRMAVPRGSA